MSVAAPAVVVRREQKTIRLLLTFGRVLSRLGKVQTSLPLHSLLQNLQECKKSRILTRATRA